MTRLRCAVHQKAGIADPESLDARTEFPCCLILHVTIFCAQARAFLRERVRSVTQLDGKIVAAVARCIACRALRVLLLLDLQLVMLNNC